LHDKELNTSIDYCLGLPEVNEMEGGTQVGIFVKKGVEEGN
jgi:hypothetical protein